ncbi:hypothetical protein LG35_07620 [Alistipes inops]|jgi:hypothetical protein|uniref:Uncharacterized protein n=1 Tax=Alistipes inops TaxID=1501391 RepID=A0ABR4YHX1_9BACT|nr:hypothetical protein LG35_07620 [Alistipes inops]
MFPGTASAAKRIYISLYFIGKNIYLCLDMVSMTGAGKTTPAARKYSAKNVFPTASCNKRVSGCVY